MPKIEIALQLYTVRSVTAKDFVGTVKEVAKMGYHGVEMAGFGDLKTAAEVKKALDDAGLKVVGEHVGLDKLEKDLNAVLDQAQTLGHKNIIIPWLGEERRKSAEAWKQNAAQFSKLGQQIVARGYNFAYHNHAFEFDKFDGQSGFDILWNNTDPKYVRSELDVYWVKYGGEDPVGYINKLGQRILSLHLKDMAPGADRKFAEIGKGILDFRKIIESAQAIGVKNYVVEQDNTYDVPPLEAARTSFENLKKIGVV